MSIKYKRKATIFTSWLQTVEKPLSLIKMGSQGRSPRQGLGAVAPVIKPLPTGKGFGVRDREISLFFKKTDFFYKLKPRFLHRGFMFLYNYIFSAILSPISEQDSFVMPSLIISPVRKPSFSTLLTAFSTASASFTISKL